MEWLASVYQVCLCLLHFLPFSCQKIAKLWCCVWHTGLLNWASIVCISCGLLLPSVCVSLAFTTYFVSSDCQNRFECFARQSPFSCCLSCIWTGQRPFMMPTDCVQAHIHECMYDTLLFNSQFPHERGLTCLLNPDKWLVVNFCMAKCHFAVAGQGSPSLYLILCAPSLQGRDFAAFSLAIWYHHLETVSKHWRQTDKDLRSLHL